MQPAQPTPRAGALPAVLIDLFQPGDRGSFVIRAIDATTQKVITQNTLPESIGDTQYLYTARLLEHNVQPEGKRDDSWKKTDRYKDVVRYGQKLYTDLFGEKNEFRQYMRRASHLKNGVLYLLRLHNTASELWNIPWEYLHDGDQFLGIDGASQIVRTAPDIQLDQTAQALEEVPYPLRVLLFIADPKGVAPLNIDYEVQTIMGALQPAIAAGHVELDIVEHGSLANLETNLVYEQYHVLYYTGHGAMTQEGSVLVMEDDDGQICPADLNMLHQTVRKAGSLRLAVLSACQSGQIDETRAASGIATGMLEVVPAVVAMQFSVLDKSAQVFARTFFQHVGQGATLEQAMQQGRLAMNQDNPAMTDWGVPALYVSQPGMRLINPRNARTARPAAKAPELEALPRPSLFVGRRDEQRKLRQILPFLRCNVAYLWGMAGIGKSALVRRILERPGRKNIIESALVISCDKTQPNQMLVQLADWLTSISPEAGAAMRNGQVPPDRRLQAAALHVQGKRFALIFDHFDAYLTMSADRNHWELAHPALAAFFQVVANAPWSVLTLFTSRYRWKALNDLDSARHIELQLAPLNPPDVGMLVQSTKHLKTLPEEALVELLNIGGGHSATIHQLEAQAAKGAQALASAAPRMSRTLAKTWESDFLGSLLAKLTPVELDALRSLSVMESVFWTDDVQFAAGVPSQNEAELMIAHWEALSLVHFVHHDEETGAVSYEMTLLVRSYLQSNCTPDQLKELHRHAASLIERDLASMAHSRWKRGVGPAPAQGDTYTVARMEMRLIIERAEHNVIAYFIQRALTWRKHFIQIGDYSRAANVVNDVWLPIKERYGQPALARKLLEETIETTTGRQQYLAQTNLATFLKDEGKFDEALKILEEAYRKAMKDNDLTNAAIMLGEQGANYFRLGKPERAVKCVDQASKLYRKLNDSVGEAGALRQTANYYHQKEKYPEALKFVSAAEQALQGQSGKDAFAEYASVMQMKGIVLKRMGKYQPAFDCYQKALKLSEDVGSLSGVGAALSEMADVMRMVKRPGDAARLILDAISIAEQLKDHRAWAQRLHTLALIYEQQGSIADAMAMVERALVLGKKHAPNLMGIFNETLNRLRRKR